MSWRARQSPNPEASTPHACSNPEDDFLAHVVGHAVGADVPKATANASTPTPLLGLPSLPAVFETFDAPTPKLRATLAARRAAHAAAQATTPKERKALAKKAQKLQAVADTVTRHVDAPLADTFAEVERRTLLGQLADTPRVQAAFVTPEERAARVRVQRERTVARVGAEGPPAIPNEKGPQKGSVPADTSFFGGPVADAAGVHARIVEHFQETGVLPEWATRKDKLNA